ncbi:unnamed protein product [Auanema sp. JU1783]|nr:unnamed protein product [Auanema sp. JU1783]
MLVPFSALSTRTLGRLQALRLGVILSNEFPCYVTPLTQLRFYADKKRGKRKYIESVVVKQTKTSKQVLDVFADMSAKELSDTLQISLDEIADTVLNMDSRTIDGFSETGPLNQDLIIKVVAAYNFKPRIVARKLKQSNDFQDDLVPQAPAMAEDCVKRPPVVTIMGHVDHGKTTLLDALRNSKIVEGEFGGITQHIGAFSVQLKTSGRKVTFLDTPGHAAFASMRARGAQGADVVVLVVAADDGVKEQTVQSIKFAQSAGVPIVVAINKCDKPSADPMRTKRALLEHNVVVEELGGDVQCIEVSALHKKNLDALQEALVIQADVMDLNATPKGLAEGVVIEASVVHGIGKICTVVVTRGTLKKNSILVAGNAWCRIRTITDEHGKNVSSAPPSTPVRVSGWKEDLPSPGDIVLEASTVDRAQKAVTYRMKVDMDKKAEKDWDAIEEKRAAEREIYLNNRQQLLAKGYRFGSTLRRIVHRENRLEKQVDDGFPRLNILVRTDVDGTLEAIMDIINTYESEQCRFAVVDFGVGPPTEKDVEIAKETNALIYLFNVQPSSNVKSSAESEGIRVEHFNVIYRLVENLKSELSSQLPTKTELELVGEGHVLKEFLISDRARKKQPIAGCLVDWGNFQKNCIYKFIRGQNVVYEGYIESMKCEMEVVAQAKTNTEVGIALDNKSIRFKEDDRIEVYRENEVKQEIDWDPPGF